MDFWLFLLLGLIFVGVCSLAYSCLCIIIRYVRRFREYAAEEHQAMMELIKFHKALVVNAVNCPINKG